MSIFRLKYHDDDVGMAKEVEFNAEDPSRALLIARAEARGRSAELWREGRRLCTLRRARGGWDFWEVNPQE